jgi:hypothetical protein
MGPDGPKTLPKVLRFGAKDGSVCVGLGKQLGEMGKPGRMVEGAVQNDMANCLKWSGRWRGAACGCTSNREVIEDLNAAASRVG